MQLLRRALIFLRTGSNATYHSHIAWWTTVITEKRKELKRHGVLFTCKSSLAIRRGTAASQFGHRLLHKCTEALL